MNKPTLLIKFGLREHLTDMLKKGKLHCKSIKWFAEYEDGKLRGDEFEAVVKMQYMENNVIQLKEANNSNAQWKNLQVKTALYKEYYKEPLGNLFCMSHFSVNEGIFKIDKRFSGFGGHFVLIHNQPEFFLRIERALTLINLGFCRGEVEYLNLHTHSGEKRLYQKDNEFSFQQEYRVHLHRDFADTFEFPIGSIEDIATLHSCDDVKGFLIRKSGQFYEGSPLKEFG